MNPMYGLAILIVILWILLFIPGCCYSIAKDKGHGGEWFLYGIIFGVFALIASIGLKDKKAEKTRLRNMEQLDEIKLAIQNLNITLQAFHAQNQI